LNLELPVAVPAGSILGGIDSSAAQLQALHGFRR